MNATTGTMELGHAVGLNRAAQEEKAISWAAIAAGAVAAAALSLILLALGTGLGLSSVSPWAYEGASAKTTGIVGAMWLLIMAAVASGLGGYIAGRLRTKWSDADPDEVYFRDTAHGFLAWAVATLISAAVLTSAASSMVGTTAKTVASAGAAVAGSAGASAAAATEKEPDSTGYFVDMMLRGAKPPEAGVNVTDTRREASAILSNSLNGEISAGDRTYLAQMVANRTGMSPAESEQRVAQAINTAKQAAETADAKAREVADAARKATAYTALWVFVSLLLGAFCATLAATWGGKQRDLSSYQPQPAK